MKSVQILMMGGIPKATYGYLYNQYAIDNANFTPTDWSVPTQSQIATLISNYADSTAAAKALRETGLTHWNSDDNGTTNSSQFTALGSGLRREADGLFISLKDDFQIWCSDNGIIYSLYEDEFDIYFDALTSIPKQRGASVRLIYTGGGTPDSTITDYDGRKYDVVSIGSQYWLKQNWACTRLNNGDAITNVTNSTTWSGLTTLARCAYNNDETLV